MKSFCPRIWKRPKRSFKEALKGNQSYMREYRIKTKSGDILWIRERGQIVCDQDGRIEYITGTCTDITKEHEMQDSLEEMQQHNEMILNSLGEGLFELDRDGEVTFVNPAALNMTGLRGPGIDGPKPASTYPLQESGRLPSPCRRSAPCTPLSWTVKNAR